MMGAVDSVRIWMGPGKPDDPLLASGVTVIKVVDAKKYLADFEAAQSIAADSGGRRPPVPGGWARGAGRGHRRIGGSGRRLGARSGTKAIMAKFFGTADKLHNYIAVIDDQTLVSTYGGEEKLKKAIAALAAEGKAGSSARPQASDVAALLPAGAQAVALVTPSAMGRWVQLVQSVSGGANALPSVDFPASPPIGLALKFSATGVHGEMVMPGPALEAIGKFVAASAMRGEATAVRRRR